MVSEGPVFNKGDEDTQSSLHFLNLKKELHLTPLECGNSDAV